MRPPESGGNCLPNFLLIMFMIFVLSDDIFCVPNPCDNGGQCQESVNTILCICPAGTSGDRCSFQSKSTGCCSWRIYRFFRHCKSKDSLAVSRNTLQ